MSYDTSITHSPPTKQIIIVRTNTIVPIPSLSEGFPLELFLRRTTHSISVTEEPRPSFPSSVLFVQLGTSTHGNLLAGLRSCNCPCVVFSNGCWTMFSIELVVCERIPSNEDPSRSLAQELKAGSFNKRLCHGRCRQQNSVCNRTSLGKGEGLTEGEGTDSHDQ
jgi:hypothetical protein